jgi:hypothetical protein
MTTAGIFITEPQRRHEQSIRRMAQHIVGECRTAMALRRRAALAGGRIDLGERQHPDFKAADVRQALRYWKLLVAIAAAAVFDAVMAAPVAEHLLRSFLFVSLESATLWRFVLPATLLTAEMGISQLRTWPEQSRLSRSMTTGLALTLVLVMPLLVGETELADKGGVFGGNLNGVVAAMMLFSACIHSFVLFSGDAQHDAASYALYRWRAAVLTHEKKTCEESARRRASSAGDRFADWVDLRDSYIGQYPDARPPQPHWGLEAIDILNQVYGYEVIEPPRAARTASRSAGDARTAPGPAAERSASADGCPGNAAAVREAEERRIKETDAEVVAE